MRDKLIGSLIHGNHKPPRKYNVKRLVKIGVAAAIVLLVAGGLAYKFANYREENSVLQFLDDVGNGRYEEAYAKWDTDGRYSMDDFLVDWGRDGYYTSGMRSSKIRDSNSRGASVIVYVETDAFQQPIALLVEKDTQMLSYSPTNKYER